MNQVPFVSHCAISHLPLRTSYKISKIPIRAGRSRDTSGVCVISTTQHHRAATKWKQPDSISYLETHGSIMLFRVMLSVVWMLLHCFPPQPLLLYYITCLCVVTGENQNLYLYLVTKNMYILHLIHWQ
jgi:hypothetical protein